jgi:hypothetical protein
MNNSMAAPGDFNFGGIYFGTISVGNATNPQNLHVYGNPGSEVYWAFDSQTYNLEVIYYIGAQESMIENWSPMAPNPTLFNVPSICYPLPQMIGPIVPHPFAPIFPKGFTMYIFDGYEEYTIYSDGVNQMWRVDSAATTQIQRGNMLYTFASVDFVSSLITPLPCYQYSSPYTYIPDIPPAFSTSLGNATLNGMTLSVWSGMGQIWYWDSTNTPQFFLNGPSPSVVTFFQPMVPPSVIFEPPSVCLMGSTPMASPPKLTSRRQNSPFMGLFNHNNNKR